MTAYSPLKWLVVDGVPFELLNHVLDPETMPHLHQFQQNQQIFPLAPLYPNCQTPPSLFSIWSGVPPSKHHLTGFLEPDLNGTTPGSVRSGFDDWPQDINMVWDQYSQANQKIRLNQVGFVSREKIEDQLIASSLIYNQQISPPLVTSSLDPLEIPGFEMTVHVNPLDDQRVEIALLYPDGQEEAQIIALESFHHIYLKSPINDWLTIMVSDSQIGRLTCILGKNKYERYGMNAEDTGTKAGHYFNHVSLGKMYRKDLLGPKLENGGDGKAEDILMKSLYEVHRSFTDEISHSFSKNDADLYVGYYPVIDNALHEILSMKNSGRKKVRKKADEMFQQLFRWLEELVANICQNLTPEQKLIINSDHGMQPTDWECYINRHFETLGWTAFDETKNILWDKTVVAYHPAMNGMIVRRRETSFSQKDIPTMNEICHAIEAFFYKLNVSHFNIEVVSWAPQNEEFDYQLFLFPPDGMEISPKGYESYIRKAAISGIHCTYSKDPWLQGIAIMNFEFDKNKEKTLEMFELLGHALNKPPKGTN